MTTLINLIELYYNKCILTIQILPLSIHKPHKATNTQNH